jgi:hypothetical protein
MVAVCGGAGGVAPVEVLQIAAVGRAHIAYHAALQFSDTSSRNSSIDPNTRDSWHSATSSFSAEEDKSAVKSGSPLMECKSCGARRETACSCEKNVSIKNACTPVHTKFAKLPRKTARWMRAPMVPLASRYMRA